MHTTLKIVLGFLYLTAATTAAEEEEGEVQTIPTEINYIPPMNDTETESGLFPIINGEEHHHNPSQSNKNKDCLSLISSGCTEYYIFTATLTNRDRRSPICKTTSPFGPIRSQCTDKGNYRFNHGMALRSKVGAMVKSLCSGKILRKSGDSLATEHDFPWECTFKGEKYKKFVISYYNAGLDSSIKVGDKVRAGKVIGKALKCGKCQKKNDMDQHVLVKVKLLTENKKKRSKYINPIVVMRRRGGQQYLTGGKKNANGDINVFITSVCIDNTANRLEIKCNKHKTTHVLDFNTRMGFPISDIGGRNGKSHKQNKQFPFFAPDLSRFDEKTEKIKFVIPAVYHKKGCCLIKLFDVWNIAKKSGSVCGTEKPQRMLRA